MRHDHKWYVTKPSLQVLPELRERLELKVSRGSKVSRVSSEIHDLQVPLEHKASSEIHDLQVPLERLEPLATNDLSEISDLRAFRVSKASSETHDLRERLERLDLKVSKASPDLRALLERLELQGRLGLNDLSEISDLRDFKVSLELLAQSDLLVRLELIDF
jgi:archaellum component FlaC